MTKFLKICLVVFLSVLCQTNLSGYLRFDSIAPDLMIAALVALTDFQTSYGGICCGMVVGMLYDSTVGYVVALDLIAYTAIGYFTPLLRKFLSDRIPPFALQKPAVMGILCFIMTMLREFFDLGYLFLIGAEQSLVSLRRMLICCVITTILLIPVYFLVHLLFRRETASENKVTGSL